MTRDITFSETIGGADATSASPDYTRTIALLECWSEWRGTVRRVLLRHMQPRCTLGRWVKSARQGGELWAHNDPRNRPVSDDAVTDDLMSLVDRTICALPDAHRDALWVTYVTHCHAPVVKRCRKLSVARTTYYRHLEAGHAAVDKAVESGVGWRNVLVC